MFTIERHPKQILSGTLNYWGDGSDGNLTTSADYNFTSVQDGAAVVANLGAVSIGSGHTVTTSNRCKALVMYCLGDFVNYGTLTMTGRGAYANPTTEGVSSTGLRLAKIVTGGTDVLAASDVAGFGSDLIAAEALQTGINGDGTIYQITREGGVYGARVTAGSSALVDGNDGGTLTNGTGGGGSGAAADQCTSGQGATGTCFGGGPAGAGGGSRTMQGDATANGGPGGSISNVWYSTATGAGAGNPAGTGYGSVAAPAEDGTGGVLILMVLGNFYNYGTISANGMHGGHNCTQTYKAAGGGGSGGGRIIILYAGSYTNTGTIQAIGGYGGYAYANGKSSYAGDGGVGQTTIAQIAA
jgi:hypothetical protein